MSDIIIPNKGGESYGVNPAELKALRRQTRHFIRQNPTELVLTRSVSQDDGAGGKIAAAPSALLPQTVRITQNREGAGVERRNTSGEVTKPQWTVLTEWNADVEQGDVFSWRGLMCEVVWITDLGYIKHAEVDAR